ncbi:hypothetical protein OC846_004254 [Tilletia horrida]|uniref:Endonuclease/exonuclease/phosphatase domain-containing protein n=1 Tax=Tilletia horrida TaxID=155126 RepID=A0AAN6JR07_9BASI|nr:hypothetical protein OC846_004254 [Tilletia horrida]
MARPPAIRLGFFVFFNLLISICSLLTLFYSLTICAPRECYSIQDRLAHLHPKLVAIAGAGSADQTLQSPIASSPSSASMLKHLTLMTWNVRYDGKAQYQNRTWPVQTSPEQLPFSRPNKTYPQNETFGEYPWALRRIPLVSTILLHHPSILTLQEVLPNQLQELKALLAPTYSAIGAGRNDASGTRGEAVPVFYRSDLFELVPSDQGGVGPTGFEHFWLSPTPDQAGSVGWDASQTRMCTHLALRAFGSGQIIHLFSTHFDDQGQLARAESAKLIRRRANDALASTLHHQAGSGEDPLVILMGDFNSPREELAWRPPSL